mgnify:CR=1 FL=1
MAQEEFDGVIALENEDGVQEQFELLDMVEFEGRQYVAVIPYDPEDPEAEIDHVVIMEVQGFDGDTGEELFAGVEDEVLLQRVFRVFQERFREPD